jgi:integrase
MLGGLRLTSYVSRHSWASAAHQQHVPLSVISQSTGHDSEKTTEIYLKSLEGNVINKTNHELLANVFKNDG